MGNCCRARPCEQFFKPSVARRSLETYRTKGLDKLERQMIASVSATAMDGARVLEIGGGIGRIQAELLATGAADQGEVVELVGAYEPYARELARDIGSKPERRSASSTSSTILTRWSPLTSSC